MRRRRGSALSGALALSLLLLVAGACTTDADGRGEEPVATSAVDLPPSYRFQPEAITVTAGTTVSWTNHDNFTHTVQFAGEEPLRMAPGEDVTREFDSAGTFDYVCSLHPTDMRGTVVVTDAP